MSEKIEDLSASTIESLKKLIDVNMAVGKPINGPKETVLIPISKVSFGFASGGQEKDPSGSGGSNNSGGNNGGNEQTTCIGGGGGVTVTPVSFVAITDGNIKMISIDSEQTVADKIIEKAPDTLSKLEKLLKGLSNNKGSGQSQSADNQNDDSQNSSGQ